jgi:hypothetical protein
LGIVAVTAIWRWGDGFVRNDCVCQPKYKLPHRSTPEPDTHCRENLNLTLYCTVSPCLLRTLPISTQQSIIPPYSLVILYRWNIRDMSTLIYVRCRTTTQMRCCHLPPTQNTLTQSDGFWMIECNPYVQNVGIELAEPLITDDVDVNM